MQAARDICDRQMLLCRELEKIPRVVDAVRGFGRTFADPGEFPGTECRVWKHRMQRAIRRRVKLEELGGRSVEIRFLVALAASLESNIRCDGAQIRLQVERKLADQAAPFVEV